jgi:hypothetical protein
MDQLDQYRTIIEAALMEYTQIPYAYGEIESRLIVDRARDEYLLLNVGWDAGRRVHSCLIHIELIAGKVWIQRDGTEEGIAKTLVQNGIPKEQIVLAFHTQERRQYTGYAVA